MNRISCLFVGLLMALAGRSFAQWSFEQDFHKPYPFEAWKDAMAFEDGEMVLVGGDKGGLVMKFKGSPVDLSAFKNRAPALIGRQGVGFGRNTSAFTTLRFVDADGTSLNLRVNNWSFPKPDDSPKAVAFDAPLSDAQVRDAGQAEGFDFSRVEKIQLLGNWSDRPYRMAFTALTFDESEPAGVAAPAPSSKPAMAPDTPSDGTLATFGQPYLYGDWKGHATDVDGILSISAGDKGGANLDIPDSPVDLSDRLNDRLTLTGRRGSAYSPQSAYFVAVELRDADKTTRRYRFKTPDFPAAGAPMATIQAAVPLSEMKPGKPGEDSEMDWARVQSIEVKGNWSDKRIDLELAAVGLAAAAANTRPGDAAPPGPDDPRVIHVGQVGPHTLGVTIQAQRRIPGRQIPYVAEPGDEIAEGQNRWVKRGGKTIGSIVGRNADTLYTFDGIAGRPLNADWSQDLSSYVLTSNDEVSGALPVAVHRKSKPWDESRTDVWGHEYPMRHTMYLIFDEPIVEGKSYTLDFAGHDPKIGSVAFETDLDTLRSEAIHVSHVGFRPDDFVKEGFLSLWMGDGGAMDYAEGTPFRVIDDLGRVVFRGEAQLSLDKDQTEADRGRNYNLTDVYRLDFSDVSEPGTYRLVVDGVGCSYPFEIGDRVWDEPFKTSMLGLLHHRSGIELGPPFTDYVRPRTMVPGEDGFEVVVSATPMIEKPGQMFTQKKAFGRLVERATAESVPQAWGGYMDAGDWDRRVQHLFATRLLIELYDYHPGFFDRVSLVVPVGEAQNDRPDILDEALFNLDLYRRLQADDGGVRGWVESSNHPRYGELSWQESLPVFVTEPDPYASYLFAATAARYARVAAAVDPEQAAVYRLAAERAFAWADADLLEGDWDTEVYFIRDARNLAAVDLFRLTGESSYHEAFLATTAFTRQRPGPQAWQEFHQREAAYAYAAADPQRADPEVQENAAAALLSEADDRATMTMETGFGWANDRKAWVGWGQQSALVNSLSLVRAHVLTDDPRYLAAIQRAVQFGAGANPMNIALTTGVGHDWPRNPLHGDSHKSNQPAPAGITIYGPIDPIPRGADQPLYWADKKMDEAGAIYPDIRTWPALESHWDVKMHPASSEYTIMQTIGPVAYLRGYLAARDR